MFPSIIPVTEKPLPILFQRMTTQSATLAALLACYVVFSLILFVQRINPSLDGRSDEHIAADSVTYIYIADALREGRHDPFALIAMTTFPNTVWFPVLLTLAVRSTFAIVLVNYAMLLASVLLCKRWLSFSTGGFLVLLLLNPTTTISLLSVNKEIVDLLAVSLCLYAYRTHRRGVLLGSFTLAFLNRYEVCLVMFTFLLAGSRVNPWRRQRVMTLAALILGLSCLLPLFASGALSGRFEEASNGGLVVQLDMLEMHYLYAVAIIPKVAENLFGELALGLDRSYILWFNSLADVIVLVVLARRRLLTLGSDLIFFCTVGSALMAVSLVIQPRYFYFVYALLCLQAAQRRRRQVTNAGVSSGQPAGLLKV
jgi:hypothetical protein